MKKINHNQLAAFINVNKEFYYKLAYSYVHNKKEALYIFQAAVGSAFETVKNLYNPLALNSWFYQIIVEISIDYLNTKQRFIIVKMEEDITIPNELEDLVKQSIEEVRNKLVRKKGIIICILTVVIAMVLIANIIP